MLPGKCSYILVKLVHSLVGLLDLYVKDQNATMCLLSKTGQQLQEQVSFNSCNKQLSIFVLKGSARVF